MNSPQTSPQSPICCKCVKRLTRDKCKQVSFTHRPVGHAINIAKLTHKKSYEQISCLSIEKTDEVENFLTSPAESPQISWFEISNSVFPHLGVSEKVVEREMKKSSYIRRVASSKPPLSPENLRTRYEFAWISSTGRKRIGCKFSRQMKAGWPMEGTLNVGSQEMSVLPSNNFLLKFLP